MIINPIIEKWSLRIINNYFLLTAINGIFYLFGLNIIAKLELLIILAGTVIAICYLSKK